MTCQFLTIEGKCNIGLYGGNPWPQNCRACIAQGNNTTEFAAALFASRERTHPPQVRRISGCCDAPQKTLAPD